MILDTYVGGLQGKSVEDFYESVGLSGASREEKLKMWEVNSRDLGLDVKNSLDANLGNMCRDNLESDLLKSYEMAYRVAYDSGKFTKLEV